MRPATVSCQCARETREVSGYACEISGRQFVVHRLIRDGGKLHTKAWTVTEPQTGRLVASAYGRSRAVEAARRVIAEQGGPEALDAEVARRLNETSKREAATAAHERSSQ